MSNVRSQSIRSTVAAALAMTDQGLISGSNFVVSIVLARELTPADYGVFGIAFSFYLLAVVVQDALILEPFTVFGSPICLAERKPYMGTLVRWHFKASAALFLIAAALLFSAYVDAKTQVLLTCLSSAVLAIPFVLLYWLERRAVYMSPNPQIGALVALVYSGCILMGLGFIIRGHHLTPTSPFLLMAIASIFCAGILKTFSRHHCNQPHRGEEVASLHWSYGKWALLSQILTWAPANVLIWSAGLSHGTSHAGELKAIFNLVLPLQQILTALQLIILPYCARVVSRNGIAAIKKEVPRITALFAIISASYWLPLWCFAPQLLHFVYRDSYAELASQIPLLAVTSIASSVSWGPIIGFRAAQQPSAVLVTYLVMNGSAVALGIPCLWIASTRGAMLSLAVAATASVPTAFFLYRQLINLRGPIATIQARDPGSHGQLSTSQD